MSEYLPGCTIVGSTESLSASGVPSFANSQVGVKSFASCELLTLLNATSATIGCSTAGDLLTRKFSEGVIATRSSRSEFEPILTVFDPSMVMATFCWPKTCPDPNANSKSEQAIFRICPTEPGDLRLQRPGKEMPIRSRCRSGFCETASPPHQGAFRSKGA